MTFKDALTVYMMLAGGVWIVFVRTEALLKEDGLRPIYAFIVRRSMHEQWSRYVEHFVDTAFGFQNKPRAFIPAVSRICVFTAAVVAAAIGLFLKGEAFLLKLFFVVLITACNAPFDLISVAKTRFLILHIGYAKAWIVCLIYLALDLIGGVGLAVIAAFLFADAYGLIIRHYPHLIAHMFGLTVVQRAGAPNWDETLYKAHLVGSPFGLLAGLASLLSSLIASCLAGIFVAGLATASFAGAFRRLQRWIEYSTLVREHPLQVVSWFAIAVLTPLYWMIYTIWGRR
jgi:hypothetical protein